MKVPNKGFVMLEGSLETFSLASVVKLIDDSAATGRLAVQAALGTGSLVFEGGRLVDAAPTPGGDSLEGALSLFEYRTGRFLFRPDTVEERTLDLDVKSLMDLVEERREAWERIREVIPADATLSVLPERRIDGMVTVSAEAWRVAVLAGGRTPAQLAAATGVGEFSVCTTLLELLEQGLIVSVAHHPGQQEPAASRHPQRRATDNGVPEARDLEDERSPEPPVERLYPPEPVAEEDIDPSDLLRELGESPSAPPARKRR